MEVILSTSFLVPYHNLLILVARAILGVIFLYYGWPKIKNLKSNAGDFTSMGFHPGWFWGTIVALLEVVGALAIILGVFTQFFAMLFAGHMITGTIWKITKTNKPFTDWSYDLLILAIALLLLTTGPGMIALAT